MAPQLTQKRSEVPALQVRNTSKSFSGNLALAGVDMTVDAGEVRCLVGGNGSGKSTLIKILSGYHHPDPGGEIRIGGEVLHAGHPRASHRLGARFVHQDLGLVLEASVTDNLFLGERYPLRLGSIRDRAARRSCEESLERFGLHVGPDTLVKDLSPAERTGVAIVRAMASGRDSVRLLVLDEPTATLPAADVDALLTMVRGVSVTGVGVLYVTHRLDEVFEIGHSVTVLSNGREIGTRPTDGLTRKHLLELIVGAEVAEVRRNPSRRRTGDALAALRVEGLHGPRLVDVSFEVAPGEVIGISGVTGSGREQLNGCVFGAIERESGSVLVKGNAVPSGRPSASIGSGMAFVPAERRTHGGLMTLSATENLAITALADFWAAPKQRSKLEQAETTEWFERLTVHPRGAVRAPLSSFSGGNQQKILLAKWLRLHPAVLLLDEPTQGVDAGATAEIYRQLLAAAERGAAIVVASSDVDELIALCSRVLIFDGGRILHELEGRDVNVGSITSWSLGAAGDRKAVQV